MFPASCCISTVPTCNNNTVISDIRVNGCQTAVVNFLSDQLVVVAAVGIAFIIGEVRAWFEGVARKYNIIAPSWCNKN